MNIIDSHMHVWQLSRGDYRWLSPDLPLLYRDHLISDAIDMLAKNGVQRTILVQAADSIAETEYLLSLAASETERIAGVVGWIDFTSGNACRDIKRLSEDPLLIGFRPMLQDISPLDWILQPQFENVFDKMVAAGLVFDALISAQQLGVIMELAQRHPHLQIVVDHCAKPNMNWSAQQAEYRQWFHDIEQLAGFTNVAVKISGLPSESAGLFTPEPAATYIQQVLDCFGDNRVMWGSDWPVVNQQSNYSQWLTFNRQLVKELGLNAAQQNRYFAGNVAHIYGLSSLEKEDSTWQ